MIAWEVSIRIENWNEFLNPLKTKMGVFNKDAVFKK